MEWISVEDRLPEKYTEVYVYPYPTEYVHTAQYGKFKSEHECWLYGEYERNFGHCSYECKPTHWMPKEPPKNSECGGDVVDEDVEKLKLKLRDLVLAANTVSGCYTRNPANFAGALSAMDHEAQDSQKLLDGGSA